MVILPKNQFNPLIYLYSTFDKQSLFPVFLQIIYLKYSTFFLGGLIQILF
jgi:hypothetical protein